MENQADNNTGSGSGHLGRHSSGRSSGQSSEHSHQRHHRHSSHHRRGSSKPYPYPKRPRIEDRPKRDKEKKIESVFTKNILTILGVIFIAGAVWFGIENWDPFKDYIGSILDKNKTVNVLNNKQAAPEINFFTPTSLHRNPKIIPSSHFSYLIFSVAFILTTLAFSVRRKNMALRLFSFSSFILLMAWLLFKLFITADLFIFYTVILLSSLFFILFFALGFVDPYPGKRRWKRKTEYSVIILNSILYYLVIKAALFKAHYRSFEPAFIFLLSSFHLFALYYTDKKNLTFRKIPFLLATLIITCLFLPLIFGQNQVILFLAPFSVFMVIFTHYSQNQKSVLYSLLAMLIMILVYFYQWAYFYIPEIVQVNGIRNDKLFINGLIASFFVFSALAINNSYLKKLAISFSNKWLKKIQYLKYMKASYLIVAYLTGYWIFNYLVMLFLKDERGNMLTWFAFNCLYFIFFLHYLAGQRSSFFRLMVITAVISTFAYFTFVHLNLIGLRKLFFEMKSIPPVLFYMHYAVTGLLIWLIFTLLHYFKRAFPGKKTLIKSFWVYIYLISAFILLSEYDHLTALLTNDHGSTYKTVLENNKVLPYSLLLLFSTLVVIIAGFLVKSRFLRIFSLVILGSVLIKIMLYDRNYLSPHVNIVLFLLIGISLLILSFSYPKIRKIFFQKDTLQSLKFFTGSKNS